MNLLLRALLASATLLFTPQVPAQAAGADPAPLLIHADLLAGAQAFDAGVAAIGRPVHTQTLHGLSDGARRFALPGLDILGADGLPRLVDPDYAALRALGLPGALSGAAIGLVPSTAGPASGLLFRFEQPISAFGLEIGDWGTCCFASSLYLAFDGGPGLAVATAQSAADNPGWLLHGQYTQFVGAIAPAGRFSQVALYGDGLGEYLVAGGTLRWAQAAALPGSGALGGGVAAPVPELKTGALLLAGLIALPWLSRRRVRPLPVRRLR
ncbi:hypothetical protein [Aquabacterium sp. OR-4]|uniref:hypothetical protein n=1 Tax=Aquabacterium sp. OR-4 TaxID=2978127 RepID=UPI0021B41CED|nr:hypothetical protein [Aquabacterium sp. OR-4]MDT7834380.1 hypothetical protein [Aquabacterium sp. OR-4]